MSAVADWLSVAVVCRRVLCWGVQMQACGEPPEEIVADMTNTIAADLPNLAAGGGSSGLGDLNFDDLDLGGLGDVPDLKNCPVQ